MSDAILLPLAIHSPSCHAEVDPPEKVEVPERSAETDDEELPDADLVTNSRLAMGATDSCVPHGNVSGGSHSTLSDPVVPAVQTSPSL